MSSQIFEEEGQAPAAGGMATAQQKIEKQARQLAYDTRYQVKKEIGEKRVNPAAMKRLLLQRLQKSTAAPNVKVRAKQMLLGENYMGNVEDFAAGTVANALFKVFVEGTQEVVSEKIELEYLKELEEKGERKYKVRVTDKKTGNSYVRYATREKITQLRANPNIQSVEMTEYGEPREGEKTKGEQTAKAKSGKGLDPVGKEDKDIDNDGDHDKSDKYLLKRRKAIGKAIGMRKESLDPVGKEDKDIDNDGDHDKSDEYLLNRRKVRGSAIAKKKGVSEEFIADAATEDQNTIKITGKGVNNYAGKDPVVKVMPEDPTAERPNSGPRSVYAHYEADGEVIVEKAVSKAQQKFMGMVYAVKKGAKPMSKEVAQAAAGMSKKEARKFAKTKHEGLPTHKEEADCGCEEKPKSSKKGEMDVRELPTKMNMVKNKLRAMGLKMSYEPEGNSIDEVSAPLAGPLEMRKIERRTQQQNQPKQPYLPPSSSLVRQAKVKDKKPQLQVAGYELEGEVIDERRREERGTPRPSRDRAYELVKQSIRRAEGTPPGQQKKEKGKKPPVAGEYGAPKSPAQKVALRRAQAEKSKEMQSSRFD